MLVASSSSRSASRTSHLDQRGSFVEACRFLSVDHDVLIFGASTRAAAFSAVRCGLRPHCADYFADRDLAAICPVGALIPKMPPANSPHLRKHILRRLGFTPADSRTTRIGWTGSLAEHRLWGMDADTAPGGSRSVAGRRSPRTGRDALPRGTARFARLASRWKLAGQALKSGGGRGIEPLTEENAG